MSRLLKNSHLAAVLESGFDLYVISPPSSPCTLCDVALPHLRGPVCGDDDLTQISKPLAAVCEALAPSLSLPHKGGRNSVPSPFMGEGGQRPGEGPPPGFLRVRRSDCF